MSSQFFGLNIAYTGLQAANANLTTTANNISNVETQGYSRQHVVQEAANAIRTYTSYGMAGAGVDAKAIEQVRNEFYDLKFWNSNANLGCFEIKEEYMRQIEDYFTETDTARGFGTIYSDMFAALDEVYKSPADTAIKTEALASIGNLCEYFNSSSTNLRKLQEDANAEIKNEINQINTIAAEIASINKQINAIEINGIIANELRDKRSLFIDELSKYVDVEVDEVPIFTEEGGEEESGATRYFVRIAGGQELVNTYDYNTLECVARDYKVNQSDAEGLYDIVWSNGLEFNLYGKNLGGSLKGLVEIRDGNNEEYFDGTVQAVTVEGSGSSAKSKVLISADHDYMQVENKSTLTNMGIITLGNKEFEFESWEYDADTKSYTFVVAGDASSFAPQEITLDGKTETEYKGATVGSSVAFKGIPYYQEQMNEWVREFAKAMNDIELTAKDKEGNSADVLFGAKDITDDNMYHFTEDGSFTSTSDSYYQLTASNFMVNRDMIEDVSKFLTNSDYYEGQDQQDIIDKMMDVQTNKDMMSFRGCTSKEFLQCILADVALDTNSVRTFAENYGNITDSIINQRLSVSGVDNDEEALNLVKFQEAYNLASKMIQVFTEVYDRLILSTGV